MCVLRLKQQGGFTRVNERWGCWTAKRTRAVGATRGSRSGVLNIARVAVLERCEWTVVEKRDELGWCSEELEKYAEAP